MRHVCDGDGLRTDRETVDMCIYFAVTVSLFFVFVYFPVLLCFFLHHCCANVVSQQSAGRESRKPKENKTKIPFLGHAMMRCGV